MPDDKLPTPDRVLVVAAHPDDIEFGAAGTVARWVAEGATVRYLLATRGDKGSDDPATDVAALVELREREQRVRGRGDRRRRGRVPRRARRAGRAVTAAARADHARHPVVPAGGRHDPRSDRALRQQRVGEPSRPSRRRPGDGRCRLPDGPRPAQLPRASRGRPGGLEGGRALPVEHQRGEPAGRHRGHAWNARSTRCGTTPASSDRSTRSPDGCAVEARSSASAPATAPRRASGA